MCLFPVLSILISASPSYQIILEAKYVNTCHFGLIPLSTVLNHFRDGMFSVLAVLLVCVFLFIVCLSCIVSQATRRNILCIYSVQ